MVVFLDLLIIINFCFNFLLITVTGWMSLQQLRLGRYAMAALAGTVIWLIFFFWPQYIFISWVCRIAGGLAIACIAWKPAGLKKLVSKAVLLVVAGQLVGGGIYSLIFALDSTQLGRGGTSIPISMAAGGGVLMLGIAAWWAGRLHKTRQLRSYVGTVTVSMNNKSLTVPALMDSGNTMRHPVNSWPVVVLERQAARSLFSPELMVWLDEPLTPPPVGMETHIALIPYKTLSSSGLLAAVHPDELVLASPLGTAVLKQVYVAVRQKHQQSLEYQALAFPADNWKEGDTA